MPSPLPPPHRPRYAWLDRVAGSDPGLNRLRLALQVLVSVGLALAADWVFVRHTRALLQPTAGLTAQAGVLVAGRNHAVTVVGITLGAVIALMGVFSVDVNATPQSQLISLLFTPVPMIAMLSFGLGLHSRVLSLASLVVVVMIGTYCRRFGPRGFVGGILLFIGAVLGFFLNKLIDVSAMGWLVAEIGIGVLAAAVVNFALFYPDPPAAVDRMQRSYAARVREVAADAVELFDEPIDRAPAARRLQRQLIRLNEAALLIDAQLGDPAAVPPDSTAGGLHQRLFDVELSVANVARFATSLSALRLPDDLRAQVRAALLHAREQDPPAADRAARKLFDWLREDASGLERTTHVIVHRFAVSMAGYAEALAAWLRAGDAGAGRPDGYQAQVTTSGGWLPGSAIVSGVASQEGGTGLVDGIRLAPYARVAVQIGVAVGAAIALGDVLSGRRFYWAMIAAFVTFMGTNTADEQVRKGLFRVLGTLIGVVVGSALAHLVGDRVGRQIAAILLALFFTLYLERIHYTFAAIGITVLVSQIYVQVDQFSNGLLALRLKENAIGAALAVLTGLIVLPLRTSRVARVATQHYLEALDDLLTRATSRLGDPGSANGSDAELRAASRRIDVAYQALVATVRPLRTPLLGPPANRTALVVQAVTATRHYARNLVLDTMRSHELDSRACVELAAAGQRLSDSVAAVVSGLSPARPVAATYVRAASLFDRVASELPEPELSSPVQLALLDLQMIDAALAEIARLAGLAIADLDTTLA
jgi:uncharacterized membrane protein YgaE (UPF0421/DUF939 family)